MNDSLVGNQRILLGDGRIYERREGVDTTRTVYKHIFAEGLFLLTRLDGFIHVLVLNMQNRASESGFEIMTRCSYVRCGAVRCPGLPLPLGQHSIMGIVLWALWEHTSLCCIVLRRSESMLLASLPMSPIKAISWLQRIVGVDDCNLRIQRFQAAQLLHNVAWLLHKQNHQNRRDVPKSYDHTLCGWNRMWSALFIARIDS